MVFPIQDPQTGLVQDMNVPQPQSQPQQGLLGQLGQEADLGTIGLHLLATSGGSRQDLRRNLGANLGNAILAGRQARIQQATDAANKAAVQRKEAIDLATKGLRETAPGQFEKVQPPSERFSVLSPEQKAELGIPEGVIAQQNEVTREIDFTTPKIGESGTGVSNKQRFEMEQGLRKEAAGINKQFREQQDANRRIGTIPDTAAGDLALVFNFMKINDPTSVVRESEFKTAEQSRAWLARMEEEGKTVPAFVVQAIQKFQTGERLLPEQRKDFIDVANKMFGAAEQLREERLQPFENTIKDFGLTRDNIFQERKEESAQDFSQMSDEELRAIATGQ